MLLSLHNSEVERTPYGSRKKFHRPIHYQVSFFHNNAMLIFYY